MRLLILFHRRPDKVKELKAAREVKPIEAVEPAKPVANERSVPKGQRLEPFLTSRKRPGEYQVFFYSKPKSSS